MVTCSLWYTFWCKKDDVRFEILHRLFGGLRNTISYRPLHSQESVCRFFETLRKLVFVVSDRLIEQSASAQVTEQQPTSFISMITLAIENATLTGLVSTHSGTLLMSVCANREATPRRSFVTAFQSATCVWEFGPAIHEVRLVSQGIFQTQRLSVLQTHLDPRRNLVDQECLIKVLLTGRGR